MKNKEEINIMSDKEFNNMFYKPVVTPLTIQIAGDNIKNIKNVEIKIEFKED